MDVIVYVICCFEDFEIIYVEGKVDLLRDLEIIEIELRLFDLEFVDKRFVCLEK